MSAHDERMDYYLMITRLMAEADAQLDADAHDPASIPYAEDLATLREAIQTAEETAARIVVALITSKRTGMHSDRDGDATTARH